MKQLFELAAGSTIGRDHRRLGRNNQDKYCAYQDRDITVLIVADGCGSTPHSEVGAYIGSKILLDIIVKNWRRPGINIYTILDYAVKRLQRLISVGLSVEDIRDSLLFTAIGCVICESTTTFFCVGDGVIVVNGSEILIESPGNAPHYLTYLLEKGRTLANFGTTVFEVPTAQLESFLVGTDGVVDLIDCATNYIPGKDELVGGIDQFWVQDKYFANPDMINRRLRLINADPVKVNAQTGEALRFHGLLGDDTTIVVGRLKTQPKEE